MAHGSNTLHLPIPDGTPFKDRAEGVSLLDGGTGLYIKYFRNPEMVTVKRGKLIALHEASPSHTVEVHGLVFKEGRIAGLSMEFVPDAQALRILTEVRKNRQSSALLSDSATSEIIRQMREALKELHSHGIHHSDLNYTNILISPVDGNVRVYLIDPGVGRCESAANGFRCNEPQHFARERQRMEDMIFSFITGQPDKRFF